MTHLFHVLDGHHAECPICHLAQTPQHVFDEAEREANESPIALLGMVLYKTPWVPDGIRKWGSGIWNRYYRRALPHHLRGTR